MTTLSLQPGQSRRADARLADSLNDLPVPPGDTLARVVAVHEVCPPGARYTPDPLELLTLFLTLRGQTQVRVGPRVFEHQTGSMMAIAAGSRIAEQVAAEQPWHVFYLQLGGVWADQMNAWLRRQDPGVATWPTVPPRRRQGFATMVNLALTQGEGWQWSFLSHCAELWGGLFSDAAAASPGDALVLQVARLLDAAPAERLSVAEMAALLHRTPRQLIYQFGKAAGEPLAQWVRRRRVAAARRLLGQGHSVTSVAEQLGYANPYHFSRTFKAVAGIAPSVVRESGLNAGLHDTNPRQ